ncbi:MAG: class I SAM-dependent methyltransferase [Beijerinckiaceae bacterium]
MSNSNEAMRALRSRYESGDKAALEAIKAEAAKYQFYHNIEIVPGLVTAGDNLSDGAVTRFIGVMEGLDFKGKRVLDIGCRDGAMSFASERMGAAEIIAFDNDLPEGLTNFLIPLKGSNVRAFQYNVNDLSRDKFGEFDIILFPGVLYHLRYPIWSLRRIADVLKPGGALIIEGGFIEGFGDLPILFCPIGTDSPYEITSVTFFNEAGITDTLLSLGFSAVQLHDTYSHTFNEQTEREFLAEKFPKFFMDNAGHFKISVCRKIFSCVKTWSDDKRINSFQLDTTKVSPEDILQRYWDGYHGINTRGSIAQD